MSVTRAGGALLGDASRSILLLAAVIPARCALWSGPWLCGEPQAQCPCCFPHRQVFGLFIASQWVPTGTTPSGAQEGEACRLSCILGHNGGCMWVAEGIIWCKK